MKNNLRRLKAVLNLLNPDLFYSIGVCSFDISLQGNYNANTVKLALKHKFQNSKDVIDVNGHVNLRRGCISIVLT